MGDWSSKGKGPEEIVRDMEGLGHISVDNPLPHTMSAAIHMKLVGKLCDTIDTASDNFVRQSNDLKVYIEAAGEDFKKQSDALRESFREVRNSLDEFKKSSEKASSALTIATYVLAFVALVQAVILAYPLFK